MTRTVIPIPPSFDKGGLMLQHDKTFEYLKWLHSQGVNDVMTTAGTSQFNMMNTEEILHLNETVAMCFPGNKIIGVPALNTFDMQLFLDDSMEKKPKDTSYILLYPDRFYHTQTLIDYFKAASDIVEGPVYVHDMGMRSGTGGSWEYTAEVINEMHDRGIVKGIKEEHPTLDSAFKFVSRLHEDLDVIVAGGSMRRHSLLRHAGANAFLGGLGNLLPETELEYCKLIDEEYTKEAKEVDFLLKKEKSLFEVFMAFGWHRSLREGMSQLGHGCDYDRMPWPKRDFYFKRCIKECIEEMIK
tara:strand:+ start:10590 stop:11486 length:897 start_codon:yes stop_codon:yes gene_type:complete